MTVNLFNGSTLNLKDVRHVPKLKRNWIFVGRLVDVGVKNTFDGNLGKITKGAMIMSYGKKKVPST